MLTSVLLSAGIWSWMRLNNAPSVGTWTDTGTIIQVIGDPPEYLYIRSGGSAFEDTIDFSEFDSSFLLDEGDQVTVWVASVPETVYSPYWGTSEIGDRHIVKVQSQRGMKNTRPCVSAPARIRPELPNRPVGGLYRWAARGPIRSGRCSGSIGLRSFGERVAWRTRTIRARRHRFAILGLGSLGTRLFARASARGAGCRCAAVVASGKYMSDEV